MKTLIRTNDYKRKIIIKRRWNDKEVEKKNYDENNCATVLPVVPGRANVDDNDDIRTTTKEPSFSL